MNDLYNNDCLTALSQMRKKGMKVQFTVTSPPYYNARDYSSWTTYDDYLSFLTDVFSLVYDVTEDGRMCCVNVSCVIEPRKSRSKESVRYPIPFDLVRIMCGIGWKFIDDIIWEKPEGAVPNRNGCFSRHRKPIAYKPNSVTEYIIVFQKPTKGLIDSIIRHMPDEIVEKSLVKDGYERTNIWRINPETKSHHPAPFPLELPSKLITYYSFVGDTVLDPFMGSGTTCIAAKRLDRHYVGIEVNEEFFSFAKERING
ncbi:MAG: site-specific DNA-methyltransferase [Paludibacteraceae bacterium]|nr:site-specific DNA-methyltransferase [Paludibacteraceae bacterium]